MPKITALPAASGVNLTDLVVKVNDPSGSPVTQKATVTQLQSSLTGKQDALGFTPENVANKDTDGTLAANSDTKYASQKATKTYADTKQSALGFTPENVANKDTDGTLAANSDTKYASQKATKTYVDTQVATVVDTWKDTYESGYIGGQSAASLGDVYGLTGTGAGSDGVVSGVSKTQLPGSQFSTNSVTNSQAAWGGVTQYTFGTRLKSVLAVMLTDITNVRAWVGFTNATGLQQLGSATPAFSYAAFRFDTSVPDTTWIAMCGNGSTQSLVNTLVAPSTTVTNILMIDWSKDATSVLFYINNNLVATIPSNLPAQAAVLRQTNAIQTLANAQKFIIVSQIKVRMSSLA